MPKSTQEGEEPIYHATHDTKLHGCLPLYLFVAFIGSVVIFFFVDLRSPEEVVPRGKGQVFLKRNDLFNSNLHELSPLPLRLPQFADPAQYDREEIQPPLVRYTKLEAAPAPPLFEKKPYSPFFNKERLLALPEHLQSAQKEEPQPQAAP